VELSPQPIPTTTTATSSNFVNLFIYILLALIANSTNVEIFTGGPFLGKARLAPTGADTNFH
ncbi:MAG: hypothetical protein LBU89_00480, partial [Fibromonadaceae bacterium]|nr:hypothetical protein [Fibromonadaceae bacterium]